MSVTDGISTLLNPRSVAVVGASNDLTKLRGRLLKALLAGGYPGRLYPVTRSAGTVQGLTAHPTLTAIGEPVDLAIVVVPAAHVEAVLQECAASGARSVVVHTASDGGHDLGALIAAFTERTGIPVLGPNTEGFLNVLGRLSASFTPVLDPALLAPESTTERDDRVSLVSQSGGVGFGLYSEAVRLGVGFRYVVTTGGEGGDDLLSVTDALIDEGGSRAILLSVEGFKRPERFAAVAAKAADAGVPLIAMKVGRSQAGARSAVSHTGALAGTDTAYDAMFERYGVIRVSDPEEMIGAAAVLGRGRLPRGNRVALLTTTGGVGGWACDLCTAAGLDVPELSGRLRARLDAFVPSYGSTQNPVDVTADALQNGARGLVSALGEVGASDEVDSAVVMLNLTLPHRVAGMAPQLAATLRSLDKPVVFVSNTPPAAENVTGAREAGAAYAGLRGSALGLAAAVRYEDFRRRWTARTRRERRPRPRPEAGGAAALLRSYGVALAPETIATEAPEAVAFAERVGYPVVLKVASPDIPHKTEAKAVALDVADADGVRRAYEQVLANARAYRPGARITGVQVQKMMPAGREMVLGMVRDADFGPLLMLGFGGVYVDVLRDVVFQPVPVGADDARRMISGLRGTELLHGVRGEPGADTEALAALIERVSDLVEDAGDDLKELDLNPVALYAAGRGYAVLDALIVRESDDAHPTSAATGAPPAADGTAPLAG